MVANTLLDADPRIELLPYYQRHLDRRRVAFEGREPPHPPLPFDVWADYLRRTELATVEGTRAAATPAGTAFVRSIQDYRLPRFQAF
jgi:hypothetical protein